MDTKKKRNKKKKANQAKNSEETISNTEETIVHEHENDSEIAPPIQNEQGLVVALQDHDKESDAKQPIQNRPVSVDMDKESVSLAESDKEQDKHNILEENFLNLEDKVKKMQDKIETHVLNEAYLVRKQQILQNENDMLAKKQVTLEDKFERIEDLKHSSSLKETSLNGKISWLEEGNKVLHMRVKELENSASIISQENKRLGENFSFLESRIEALESKKLHDIGSSPVENLPLPKTDENVELPVITGESSNGSITIEIDEVEKLGLQVASMSEETVHDGLHDVEINEEIEEENGLSSDGVTGEDALPLSDAPLIGAPFRLFSFVAKFVAGSDLVNETSSAPDR